MPREEVEHPGNRLSAAKDVRAVARTVGMVAHTPQELEIQRNDEFRHLTVNPQPCCPRLQMGHRPLRPMTTSTVRQKIHMSKRKEALRR